MDDVPEAIRAPTTAEAASRLDGNEYLAEGTKDLFVAMARAGLVAVFGGSDDQIYFCGAMVEELAAQRKGAVFHVTRAGVAKPGPDGDGVPDGGAAIEARWCENGFGWSYVTAIPHATFRILEDGEPYCRGLVFAVADLAA